MKNKRIPLICILIFFLGVAAGVFARGKGLDPAFYRSKPGRTAGMDLLNLARSQAGKGSWENIAVGRVYYLAGSRGQGQAIFDAANAKKADSGNWMRIGRTYWQAKEWTKAQAAFEKALAMEPKDAPWLAEIGAYYNLKGDRAKAEELFDRSFALDSSEVWQTVNIAGSYLGVEPVY
jgi:tetratricopeptide (TPR) repeat protein